MDNCTQLHIKCFETWLGPKLWSDLQPQQRAALSFALEVLVTRTFRDLMLRSDPSLHEVPFLSHKGFIVAHGMGLGKTVTTIAVLRALNFLNRKQLESALKGSGLTGVQAVPQFVVVVIPVSAVYQWEKEIHTWWQNDRPITVVNAEDLRFRQKQRIQRRSVSSPKVSVPEILQNTLIPYFLESQRDLVKIPTVIFLCGAPTFLQLYKSKFFGRVDGSNDDAELFEALNDPKEKRALPIDILVVDEVHRFSVGETNIAEAIRCVNSRSRLLLTGNPVQNRIEELHTILQLANPSDPRPIHTSSSFHQLTLQQFRENFVLPIETGMRVFRQLAQAQSSNQSFPLPKEAVLHYDQALTQLVIGLEKYMHRAPTNLLYSLLPPLRQFIVYVALTPVQARCCMLLNKHMPHFMENEAKETWLSFSRWQSDACFHPSTLSAALMKLRKPSRRTKRSRLESNENSSESSEEDRCDNKEVFSSSGFLDEADAEFLSSPTFNDAFHDINSGAKLKVVIAVLQCIMSKGPPERQRVLIFASSGRIRQCLISALCRDREDGGLGWTDGVDFVTLHGRQSSARRQSSLDSFCGPAVKSPRVFILSVKAGGVALNLTMASFVFFLDYEYNPAHHNQALFRAYRIGQCNPVTTYHFLVPGAAESHIFSVQRQKQTIADALSLPEAAVFDSLAKNTERFERALKRESERRANFLLAIQKEVADLSASSEFCEHGERAHQRWSDEVLKQVANSFPNIRALIAGVSEETGCQLTSPPDFPFAPYWTREARLSDVVLTGAPFPEAQRHAPLQGTMKFAFQRETCLQTKLTHSSKLVYDGVPEDAIKRLTESQLETSGPSQHARRLAIPAVPEKDHSLPGTLESTSTQQHLTSLNPQPQPSKDTLAATSTINFEAQLIEMFGA